MFMTILIVLSCLQSISSLIPYDELFFNQTLDHFKFSSATGNDNTFLQRYLVSKNWWYGSPGPIFLYTGNEGDITDFWDNTGFIFEIAPKFNPLIVFIEHRFYGKSLPCDAQHCFKGHNIDTLNVEQALADFAIIIRSILREYCHIPKCPVIAFGGSYGGMLSAYMRMKYPQFITGSIAASAPFLMVSQKVDKDFFFRDTTRIYDEAHESCVPLFKKAFVELEKVFHTGKSGYVYISKLFKLCKSIELYKQYIHLLGWIRNSITTVAMVNYPYKANLLAPLPAYPVHHICGIMRNDTLQLLERLAQASSLFYGPKKCHDIYSEFVDCADPSGCGIGSNGKSWDFQACTEFLLPSCNANSTYMFPCLSFSLEDRKRYCLKNWNVTPRDDWLSIQTFSSQFEYTSNIILSNGNLDPWRLGGILHNISDTVKAFIVDGGAHHFDLRGSHPLDPESVKFVRQKEIEYISKWIKV